MDSTLKKPRARAAADPSTAAPDGGYAWFIMVACFMVSGLTLGALKSFGVFHVNIQEHFDTTATSVSWVMSITLTGVHAATPLASVLSVWLGHRSVVIIGGLLCGVGAITGSFARNPLELCLTVGLLNGVGYSLSWSPSVSMVGLYFNKRRPIANALSSTGESIFTFVFTPLSQWLIDIYSWRGAMLILGGLQLNLCVCGALLRPLTTGEDLTHTKEVKADEEKMLRNDPQCLHQEKKRTLKSKILPYLDYTLIANADFMIYSMFGMFAALGFFPPTLFLVSFARSRGVEEYNSTVLLSISSVMDLIGRLAFGWLANLRLIKTVHQLTVTVILLATVVLLCPLASSFAQLAVCSGAFGLAFGATVAIHITVLAEVVGVHRLGSALGFFMLIRSFGALLGPPIAGFFVDQMDDYSVGFFMAGTALLISAAFLILLEVKGQRSRTNKLRKLKSETAPSNKDDEETEMARESIQMW